MFRPKPDALPEIYTTLGQDYDDRVINISVWLEPYYESIEEKEKVKPAQTGAALHY